MAREKGLEPLAELILLQSDKYEPSIEASAEEYVSEEKGVASVEEALAGACDIIAEDISDNAEYRKEIRALTFEYGIIVSKKANEEIGDTPYNMYYEFSEKVKTLPGHRVLALNRGEKEDVLKTKVII